MTWRTATARLGRNDLPAVLAAVYWDLEPAEAAAATCESWVLAEWPEAMLDPDTWLEFFTEAAGPGRYLEADDEAAVAQPLALLPATVTLYRGAIPERRAGMSWTPERGTAEWFAQRFNRPGHDTGALWRLEAPRDLVLARITGHRGEHEWVLDPQGIDWDAIVAL